MRVYVRVCLTDASHSRMMRAWVCAWVRACFADVTCLRVHMPFIRNYRYALFHKLRQHCESYFFLNYYRVCVCLRSREEEIEISTFQMLMTHVRPFENWPSECKIFSISRIFPQISSIPQTYYLCVALNCFFVEIIFCDEAHFYFFTVT